LFLSLWALSPHVSHLAAAVDPNRPRAGLERIFWRSSRNLGIIGLPIVDGFAGTCRLIIGDGAPNARHSSNSLFLCIPSKAAIIERSN
jgi:hypothetical protein